MLPPDVNSSQIDFAVVEGKIRFGLNAVKGVGEAAARAIIAAREEGGPFASIWDFTERVDPQCVEQARARVARQVRRARLHRRLAAGDARRARAGARVRATSSRPTGSPARARSSTSATAVEEEAAPRHHPADPAGEFDKNELLRMEKETLGLYVSEHPLHAIRDQLRREDRRDDRRARAAARRRVVTVGGIVGAVKQLTTKKGEPMVFLRLDDVTGGAEVVVFNSVYAASPELCVTDRILVVKGRVDHKQEGETKLLALEVAPFEPVPEKREVRLRVDASKAPAGIVRELAALLRDFPGEAPVFVDMDTRMGRKRLEFGPKFRVAPSSDFFAEVKHLLGEAAVLQ